MSAPWVARLPLPPVGLARTTRAEIEDLGAVVTEGAALAPLTTLRLGPVAATLIRCESTRQVTGTLAALDGHPALLLAGGSNVVLADDLADVTAVHIAAAGVTVDGSLLRSRPAPTGTRWWRCRCGPVSVGWNACRESRVPRALPLCRTWVRTESRFLRYCDESGY